MSSADSGRRPLASRKIQIFHQVAQSLVKAGLTPNQVSVFSSVFAFCSGMSFYFSAEKSIPLLWIFVAVVCVQLRLLCNLLDGLMAVEGGLKTKTGELYNDIPDRISDIAILMGIGYAIRPQFALGVDLAWACCALAVLTAYIRVLGASLGAGHFFIGPMAKQQRMFLVSFAGLCSMVEIGVLNSRYSLLVALVIILIGSIVTCGRRVLSISNKLQS